MSTTTALAVIPNRRPVELAEFRNAHGWGPSIWDRLVSHHGLGELWDFRAPNGVGPGLNRLWQLTEQLPEWQQAPLVLTFDTGVIPFPALGWAAEMLDEFDRRLPATPGHANHVPAMADLLRSKPEAPLFGVHGTSVSENPFESWDDVDEDDIDAVPTGIPLGDMYVLERHRPIVSELLVPVSGDQQ